MADPTALLDLSEDLVTPPPPSYSQCTQQSGVFCFVHALLCSDTRPLAFLAGPTPPPAPTVTTFPVYTQEEVTERRRVPGLPLPGLANSVTPERIQPVLLSPTAVPTTIALPPRKPTSSMPHLHHEQSEDWPAPPDFSARTSNSIPRMVPTAFPLPTPSPPTVQPTLSHNVSGAIPQVPQVELHPTNPFLVDLMPAASTSATPPPPSAPIGFVTMPALIPTPTPPPQAPTQPIQTPQPQYLFVLVSHGLVRNPREEARITRGNLQL